MNIKWPLRTKKQNKKICEDKNIQFNFLGTKSKFAIFIRTKNLFNPKKYYI